MEETWQIKLPDNLHINFAIKSLYRLHNFYTLWNNTGNFPVFMKFISPIWPFERQKAEQVQTV